MTSTPRVLDYLTSQRILCPLVLCSDEDYQPPDSGRIESSNLTFLLAEAFQSVVASRAAQNAEAAGSREQEDSRSVSSLEDDFLSAADTLDDCVIFMEFAEGLADSILSDGLLEATTSRSHNASVQHANPGKRQYVTAHNTQANMPCENPLEVHTALDSLTAQIDWVRSFRRRSSNLSDLPASRRGSQSTANSRNGSEFSSEFEEYYQTFLVQEQTKTQRAADERALPGVGKFAESFVSRLLCKGYQEACGKTSETHADASFKGTVFQSRLSRPAAIQLTPTKRESKPLDTECAAERHAKRLLGQLEVPGLPDVSQSVVTDPDDLLVKSANRVTNRLISQVFSELQREIKLSQPDSIKASLIVDSIQEDNQADDFSPSSGNRLLASLTHWAQGASEQNALVLEEPEVMSGENYASCLSKVVVKEALGQYSEITRSKCKSKSISDGSSDMTDTEYLTKELLGRRHSCFGRFEPVCNSSDEELSAHFAVDLARRGSLQDNKARPFHSIRRRSLSGFHDETLSSFGDQLLLSSSDSPPFAMLERFLNQSSASSSRRGSGSFSSSRRGSLDVAYLRNNFYPVIRETNTPDSEEETLVIAEFADKCISEVVKISRRQLRDLHEFSASLAQFVVHDALHNIPLVIPHRDSLSCCSDGSLYHDALDDEELSEDSDWDSNEQSPSVSPEPEFACLINIMNEAQCMTAIHWLAATMAEQPAFVQHTTGAFRDQISSLVDDVQRVDCKVCDLMKAVVGYYHDQQLLS